MMASQQNLGSFYKIYKKIINKQILTIVMIKLQKLPTLSLIWSCNIGFSFLKIWLIRMDFYKNYSRINQSRSSNGWMASAKAPHMIIFVEYMSYKSVTRFEFGDLRFWISSLLFGESRSKYNWFHRFDLIKFDALWLLI